MESAKATLPQFETAKRHIDRGSFDDALSALEELRGEVLSSGDPLTYGEYLSLQACVLFELGRYRTALIKARSALRMLRPTNDHHLFARAKLYMGRILVRLGRFDEASECFTESYVFFKRSRSYSSMVFAFNDLAQLHFITGNLTRAAEVLDQSIQSALRHNTGRNVNIDKRNLAMVNIKLGRFSEAEAILDEVREDAREDWELANIDRQTAIIALLRGEALEARDILIKVQPYFEKHGAARDHAVVYEYLGLAEFELGNYRRAEKLYRKVLEMPEPTVSATAQTNRLLADLYLAMGRVGDARKCAKIAEAAINRINERVELAALFRTLAKIETQRGRVDSARELFVKAIRLSIDTEARFELALTYTAAGQSGTFTVNESIGYLDIAIQMLQEMKATAHVDRIRDSRDRLRCSRVGDSVRCDGFPSVVIAASREMKHILSFAEDAAQTDFNVLLTGETGTGKDLIAAYIHSKSGRAGEFVTLNAAAVPNEMIEAELFGYAKGAYTGASGEKEGLLERASGGTFYLNEIADATHQFQAKLLEVLESHRVRRLGENHFRKVDFRLITATNKDLIKSIGDGAFREDLFYRLNGIPIHLPPLRERALDIPALIKHFLSERAGFEISNGYQGSLDLIAEHFVAQPVPGNVRELKQNLDLLWIKSGGDIAAIPSLLKTSRDDSEKSVLLDTLERTSWNRRQTARLLGVSEGTVRYRIEKYNITPPY